MTKKTEQQIRDHLGALSKDALVDAVMERAVDDPDYARRLTLEAAQAGGEVDPAVFRRAISDALTSGSAARRDGPRTSGRWANGVDAAIDPVDALLVAGQADEVVGITEYALGRCDKLMGRIDDSSGWFSGVLIRLEALHHSACVNARPDPVKLARRLFRLDVDGDWDIFIDCAVRYGDVLGEAGLAELQRLADERWAELPPAGPWGADRAPSAFHLSRMLTNLADIAGDVDAKVRVMSRELQHPYRFLEIATVLADAGRDEEALAWAERGLDGADDLPIHMRSDPRLDDFVIAQYRAGGRDDDAVALVWRRFAARPNVNTFRRLRTCCESCDRWAEGRADAMRLLRDDAERRRAQPSPARSQPPRFDDLIAVLTFEGELDEAWQLARQQGCTRSLWHDLAHASEATRPLDSAEVYGREIDELIDRKQTRTYEEAITRLADLRGLYTRAGSPDAFARALDDIRTRHEPKVKFMRLLDEAEQAW